MDKRETVITALENCLSVDIGLCTPQKCHYWKHCGGQSAPDELLRDALELLKAQEPRVMTLEEVGETFDDMWLEYNDRVYPATWGGTDYNRNAVSYYVHGYVRVGRGITLTLPIEDYGKTWRCWTARPTDEQREAVKWDD